MRRLNDVCVGQSEGCLPQLALRYGVVRSETLTSSVSFNFFCEFVRRGAG
jgi:hypothetical protein